MKLRPAKKSKVEYGRRRLLGVSIPVTPVMLNYAGDAGDAGDGFIQAGGVIRLNVGAAVTVKCVV